MKYNIKLETQAMIGGGDENRLARESALLKLISKHIEKYSELLIEKEAELLRKYPFT